MKRFEIHVHSEFSNLRLLDSINKIKDITDRAIEIGLSGYCLTDHECLSGAPQALPDSWRCIPFHPCPHRA